MTINNQKIIYTKISGSEIKFYKGNLDESLEEFLEDSPMTIFMLMTVSHMALIIVSQSVMLMRFLKA